MHQGVQSTSFNHQMADLQTSKQQIDQELLDHLLVNHYQLIQSA